MASKFVSWCQNNWHRGLIIVFALLTIGVFVFWAYASRLSWVGFSGEDSGRPNIFSKKTITMITPGATTATPATTVAIEQPPAKTLWDWLQLLIIPVVLAVSGYLFNLAMSRNQHKVTDDNQRESALQNYIDKMSELLLKEDLRYLEEDDEIRQMARVRTLTVLSRLDSRRKRRVLQFLHEAKLIKTGGAHIVSLSGAEIGSSDLKKIHLESARLNGAIGEKADLREAYLHGADFSGAYFSEVDFRGACFSEKENRFAKVIFFDADLRKTNLSGINLEGADLRKAKLRGADLSKANLSGVQLEDADLSKANLSGTELREADLSNANLSGAVGTTSEQLDRAYSLKGSIMPNGSKHP